MPPTLLGRVFLLGAVTGVALALTCLVLATELARVAPLYGPLWATVMLVGVLTSARGFAAEVAAELLDKRRSVRDHCVATLACAVGMLMLRAFLERRAPESTRMFAVSLLASSTWEYGTRTRLWALVVDPSLHV